MVSHFAGLPPPPLVPTGLYAGMAECPVWVHMGRDSTNTPLPKECFLFQPPPPPPMHLVNGTGNSPSPGQPTLE